MSSFELNTLLFVALLLAPSSPLLVLPLVNDLLFSTWAIVSAFPGSAVPMSFQPAQAQEQDEEIARTEDEDDEDEDEDENRPNNEDTNEERIEEDDEQTESIGICCSWDERLADGILTYRIIERVSEGEDDNAEADNEDNEDEENREEREISTEDLTISYYDQRKAVTDAISEWNTRIPNLRLANEDSNVGADIEVQLVDGLGGLAAGATLLRFNEDGLINKATILLPKAAFFIESDSQVFAIQYDPQKLKEIATHELGHALGLGHADFDSDLMSERLNSEETMNISQCDISAVLQANQWKLVNNDSIPNGPDEDEMSC
jgi:Matrixin